MAERWKLKGMRILIMNLEIVIPCLLKFLTWGETGNRSLSFLWDPSRRSDFKILNLLFIFVFVWSYFFPWVRG